MVSGFALNDLTPMPPIGGEPYKMSVLSETMGRGQSVSAITLYRMIYSLGHLLLLLFGVILTLLTLHLSTLLRGTFVLAGFVLLAVILILLIGHREGFFVKVFTKL